MIKTGRLARKLYEQEKILALKLANTELSPEKIEKSFYSLKTSKELYRNVPSARPAFSGGISMIKVPKKCD